MKGRENPSSSCPMNSESKCNKPTGGLIGQIGEE